MSLLPFFKNFVSVQGDQAAAAVTKALVNLDPEGASAADLRTMDQDLDKTGGIIAKLRSDLAQEQAEFDAVSKRYIEMMGAAEILNKRINTASDTDKPGLQSSLAGLLDHIERVAPELESDRKDVDATQDLLDQAQEAYKEKAAALTKAKGNLDRARHDLQRANIERARSEDRAAQAAVVAGLVTSPISGLTVALNTMHESATVARRKAQVADMKAEALRGTDESKEDPNIASALKEANGTTSPASLTERLAALRK